MAVYFIRAGTDGPVKIGVAIDPEARRAELQVGNHLDLTIIRVIDGGRAHEAWLHRQFIHARNGGEWFCFEPRMLTIELPALVGTIQTPAQLVIDRFGGAKAVADALGIHIAQVYRWSTIGKRRPSGVIPSHYQTQLLQVAAERGVVLEASELVLLPTSSEAA